MSILGVGTDVVDVERFARLVARGGRRFLERWFRPAEVTGLLAHSETARQTAARFAVKEAVLKALRVPDIGPVRWRDIELADGVDGQVLVVLHGSIRDLAEDVGALGFHVAVTQSDRVATATVMAVTEPVGQVVV